ncbi:hypothetical protein OKW49_001914 [Paraburkholderia youngii]
MISLLIAYQAVSRFLSPVPIRFGEAIPIAGLGLLVNLVSVWLLRGDHHGHGHRRHHGHAHDDGHNNNDMAQRIVRSAGTFAVSIFENGVPPVFRITQEFGTLPLCAKGVSIATVRPDSTHQTLVFDDRDGSLESNDDIPEPHAFGAVVRLPDANIRSSSRNTNTFPTMLIRPRTVTTTSARPTFTSSPTRQFPCWRSTACCWRSRLAGSG